MWLAIQLSLTKLNASFWSSILLFRCQKVVLNSHRIGRTRLTHKHLTTKTDPELCPSYDEIPTVKHQHSDIRNNLQISDSIHETLGPNPDHIEKIFKFLKLTNFST